jgi:NUMOD1 domain
LNLLLAAKIVLDLLNFWRVKLGKIKRHIWQYNADGKFMREFDSLRDASHKTGIKSSSIKSAYKLNIKAKGYYWRSAHGEPPMQIDSRQYRNGGKKIKVFKVDGIIKEPLYITKTISEAKDKTGVSRASIRAICRREKLMEKGYSFEFVQPEDPLHKLRKKRFNLSRKKIKRPIALVDDKGKRFEFESITQASEKMKITEISIQNVLIGKLKMAGNFYVEDLSEQFAK